MEGPITEAIRPAALEKIRTLGSVRLHREGTKEIILIPTPSDDPNDPLNWSIGFRYYIAALACFAVFVNNFVAAGPAITIADQAIDFFGPPGPDFLTNVGKISYFFTGTTLMEGVSILIWMPLIIKYGRRPAYILSFAGYIGCSIWAGLAESYGSELGARLATGFFAGAGVAVAPLTIADLFFLHERGAVMAWYSTALVGGGSLGNVIAGLITIHYTWRTVYYVCTALVAFCFVLMVFTMPETSFRRNTSTVRPPRMLSSGGNDADANVAEKGKVSQDEMALPPALQIGHKKTYKETVRIWNGTFVDEGLFKIFIRPFGVLLLPTVFWSTIVTGLAVGFLIAVTTAFASSFQSVYHWQTYQIALAYLGTVIGSLLGIFAGGVMSDWVANTFTKRNGGVREPEMRLPALMISVVTMTLSMVLYGAGIQGHMHWMVPTFATGLLSFTVSQALNIVMVYAIDAYRPISGEVIVAMLGFKSFFGFLLSFYTNPWVEQSGYLNAFGAMGGISGAILIMWIPFYLWGKRIRHATLRWRMFRWLEWDEDRELGE